MARPLTGRLEAQPLKDGETVHNTGATALHEAACHGRLDALRILLETGADPTIRDERFDSTPAGWAEHFGKQAAREMLEQV